MDTRLGWMFKCNNLYLKAAAMDPRFGNLSFADEKLKDEVWWSLELARSWSASATGHFWKKTQKKFPKRRCKEYCKVLSVLFSWTLFRMTHGVFSFQLKSSRNQRKWISEHLTKKWDLSVLFHFLLEVLRFISIRIIKHQTEEKKLKEFYQLILPCHRHFFFEKPRITNCICWFSFGICCWFCINCCCCCWMPTYLTWLTSLFNWNIAKLAEPIFQVV